MKLQKGVKFKTPPRETVELDRLYDVVFNHKSFDAGWCGRVGHYIYSDSGDDRAAQNQDGFVYLFPLSYVNGEGYFWRMTADPKTAAAMCKEYVEINI